MNRFVVLAWLLLFFSHGVFGLEVSVSEDVLLYPDQEFYLVMTLQNEGEDVLADIRGFSLELNTSWNRSALLLQNTGVKVGFVIDPIAEEGNYNILWSIKTEDGEVIDKKTRLVVSEASGSLGEVIGYYGFELDALSGRDSDFVSDAEKHLAVAENLFNEGMIFEAIKYVDFTRESLEAVVEEEVPQEISVWNWFGILRNIGILIGILVLLGGFLVLIWMVGKRIVEGIKEGNFLVRKKGEKVEKNKALPRYMLDIKNMKRKIVRVSNIERRRELLVDLANAEEKFRIGLNMLGRAYLDRIERELKRERKG